MSWLWDLLALVGAALLLVGLWWIYPPVALVVGGLGLVALSVWGASLWGS